MKKTNKKSTKAVETETKKKDTEIAGLIGQVKQVKLITYKAHQKSGFTMQGKILISHSLERKNYIISFDEKGFKTQEYMFGKEGNTIYKYNNNIQPVESIQNNTDGSLKQKTINKFNENGNLIESISQNANGKLNYRSVSTFSEQGKILEYVFYNGEDHISKHTYYEYNDDGNLLSSIEYNGDGSINHQSFNKYDENGYRIEYTSEYTEKRMAKYNKRTEFKNNEHGDCIEMTDYNEDGNVENTYTFSHQYDAQGKKIIPERNEQTTQKPSWEKEKCEYDAQGNWIKKTTYYHNIPNEILLREITYYDEKNVNYQPLVHALVERSAIEVEEISQPSEELTSDQAKWLVETSTPENFLVTRYYALMYNEAPSLLTFTGPYIEAITLRSELIENLDAVEVHSYCTSWAEQGEQLVRYTLNFPFKCYMLHATGISSHDADEFEIPDFVSDQDDYDGFSVYFSQIQLFRPSEASGKRDTLFEEDVQEYISKCMLQKVPDKPTINMIEATNNGFVIKEHAVDDNFEIKDLDVNYGYGFNKFHNELMHRFNTSTKGLVLFHGMPGTGKTYYIRHLLRKMAANNKVVIYMPPNMVDHLIEPVFMTFLSRKIQDWAADGNFCVLLIEDAEPLLARRQEGVRIQGITNLLNMSDGILNDMLNLQIICTFNVDIKKLDNALLRPGRLIARKEFKPLSELDANVLAQRLGIKHHFTSPVALGEIYAMQKNKNTLIHDVESDRDATTIIDDLL